MKEIITSFEKLPMNLAFKSFYSKYDEYFADCLAKLKSKQSENSYNDLLAELKEILKYEYLLSKEIWFESPENISNLVELLVYVSDIDTLNVLLQTIPIKIKNENYEDYLKKEESQWHVNLVLYMQTFVEFFSQINFSFLIENFSNEYQNIENQMVNTLLGKVQDLTQRQNSFTQLQNYLNTLVESNSKLTDEAFTNLLRLFREGNSQENVAHDVYEVSAILALINIIREYQFRQDNRIFNFLFITEISKSKLFFLSR